MLKNMEENYQGYYPGVRAVLKNRDSIPGVTGAVGELISAPAEYMTALDTALGQASQNIVMDVEHNARTAISYLKQKKLGFATFLPLDTIRERHLSVDVKNLFRHRILIIRFFLKLQILNANITKFYFTR